MGVLEEVVAAPGEMEGPAARVGVALCPAKAVPAARGALVIRQAPMALQVRTVHKFLPIRLTKKRAPEAACAVAPDWQVAFS